MKTGGSTIQDIVRRCKRWLEIRLDELGYAAVVALVGVSAFGLGRISALESARPAVSVGEAPRLEKPVALAPGGLIVASRTGSVYYFPWCAGAGNIAPQNQRLFKSEAEARSAGFRPAKNCKGLE